MAARTGSGARPGADVFLPPAAAGGASPGGGKIMGLDRNTFLVVAVVAGAIAAYLLYRHFHNASATASASGTPDTSQTAPPPDNSGGGGGGPPPQSADTSGLDSTLAGIQTEIQQLLAGQTVPTGGGAPGVSLAINVLPSPGADGGTPGVTTPTPQKKQTTVPQGSPLAKSSPIATIGEGIGAGAAASLAPAGSPLASGSPIRSIGASIGAGAADFLTIIGSGRPNPGPHESAPAASPEVRHEATASSPGRTVQAYAPSRHEVIRT